MARRNHYQDWIFYLLIVIAVIAIYSTYYYHSNASTKNDELGKTSDSLSFERKRTAELNSRFDVQSQLTIKNSGTTDFVVNRFYVFYFDKKDNKFKSCVGHIEGTIKANGGECKPKVFDGDNEIWNGNALAYYIEVVSIDNYVKKDALPFCKSGSLENGEIITINADSKSQLIDSPATCN